MHIGFSYLYKIWVADHPTEGNITRVHKISIKATRHLRNDERNGERNGEWATRRMVMHTGAAERFSFTVFANR